MATNTTTATADSFEVESISWCSATDNISAMTAEKTVDSGITSLSHPVITTNISQASDSQAKGVSTRLSLRSHKHEYESGIVRVPVYEFRQTRFCVYFNGGCSHTYEYGLPVNFTRASSFCAGHVFIQPVRSRLPVDKINIICLKLWHTFDVRTDIPVVKLFIVRGVRLVKLLAM